MHNKKQKIILWRSMLCPTEETNKICKYPMNMMQP